MSYEEVLEELKVARSTMDRWRGDGRAPAFVKLPNLNYSSPGARQHVGSTKVPAW
jgi:predicted site-specific integrase-resolvase